MIQGRRYKEKSTTVFGFSLLMLILAFYSLHFGIAPRDEPFYLAMPYRFILGDRPFIDEWNLLQTASFFILPFIKVYLYFKGSTEGIILFGRYLHFGSTILLAGLVYLSFKKITNTWRALLLSLPCIVFVPNNIHSLSYNTLTMLFLTAGYFLGFLAVIEYKNFQSVGQSLWQFNRCTLLIFCSGLCHVSAVICYPPLCLIPIIFCCCLAYFLPTVRTFIIYAAGMFIGGLWFLSLLIQTGIEPILKIYHFGKNIISNRSLGIMGYFPIIFNKHKVFFLYVLPLSFLILGLIFFIATRVFKISLSTISLFCLILLLISCFKMNGYGHGGVLLLSGVGAASLFLFLFLRNFADLYVKQFFILICIPSYIAGAITSIVSSISVLSSVIGSFPCVLVGLYYMTLNSTDLNKTKNEILSITTLLTFFVFIGGLQYFNIKHPYGENLSPLQLNYKFNNGPFKDIYTNHEGYVYYNQLAEDIRAVYKSGHHILFFDNFPAGYLFSDMRPATNTIWTLDAGVSSVNRYAMVNYLNEHHLQPDIIIKILGYKAVVFRYEASDPVNKLLENYQLILRRDGYEIYQLRNY